MAREWEPQLTQLCEERWGRLMARARVLVADTQAAEDLVQDALVATFSKHRGFSDIAQAEQYVRRAIVTRFIDGKRRKDKEDAGWERAQAIVDRSPRDYTSEVDGAMHAIAVLRDLPPRVRACIALRYLDDLTIRETAAALSLTEGAVKRYVSDGLAALNAALGTNETPHNDERISVRPQNGARS